MESQASRLDALASLWRAAGYWLAGWWQLAHLGAQMLALLLTPSTWRRANRVLLARQVWLDVAPILPGFTVMTALAGLVLIRIVIVTALSYGLTRYALATVVRVLVLELIPLAAALFAALRCTLPGGVEIAALRTAGRFDALHAQGTDPLRIEVLPRVAAGMFAVVTLAALSAAAVLVLAYLMFHGATTAALAGYTRTVGQVFTPSVSLILVLKTLFFALVVTLVPAAVALHDRSRPRRRTLAELYSVVRMLTMILVIEIVSLVGNYH